MVIGVSHHDLELDHLERLTAVAAALPDRLAELAASPQALIRGAVLLTTCNRVEIYVDAQRFHDALDAVGALVTAADGSPELAALLRVRVGAPVAAHLFTVAAGLDAMVVGEAEISGQVSAALRAAVERGMATPLLHALFQAAARTAKQVASRTDLGAAGRSVASVAIDLALRARDEAEPGTAVVIGTGSFARVSTAALRARGCRTLQVFSPSGRAESFAARHDAQPLRRDELVVALAAADLVVSCSGHGVVLDRETVAAARSSRADTLSIVDLSLPSDLGPGVRDLPGVLVVDLHSVAEGSSPAHREAVAAAQDLVIAAVARFEEDLAVRELDPAVVALRAHVSGAMEKEVTRLRAKYSPEVAAEVELSLHRVTRSLLHAPTMRARELARTGDGDAYLHALHTLFGIEIPAGEAADVTD